MRPPKDNGDIFKSRNASYASWDDEAEAISKYYRKGVAGDDRNEFRDIVATLYEYGRELYWWLTSPELDLVFDRHPWYVFANIPSFPKRPFTKLSETEKEPLFQAFSSSATPMLEVRHVWLTLVPKLEEMVALAEKNNALEMQHNKPLSKFYPRFRNAGDNIEHVLFTLDYRKGKTQLVKEFTSWLDSYASKLMGEFAVTQKGTGKSIFSDRLTDLAFWRSKCSLDWKEARKLMQLSADTRSQEFRRAADDAIKFRGKLVLTSFENIEVLVTSLQAEIKAEKAEVKAKKLAQRSKSV